MILISIIIPVYNVERYLAQCLDSVFDQNLSDEEYEVICVNDGSTDYSREIVASYLPLHRNLRLIDHPCNMSSGAARNTGCRAAHGKYVWYVDSDDFVKPKCLKQVVSICDENTLDVLIFQNDTLTNDFVKENDEHLWPGYGDFFSGLDFWKRYVIPHQGKVSPVWTQIYRKEYLDDKRLVMPSINMGEDVPFTYSTILFSRRIMAVNDSFYVWRDNSDSLTGRLKRIPSPETVYENSFVCGKAVFELLGKLPRSEKEIRASVAMSCRYIVRLYDQYIKRMSPESQKQLSFLVKRHFLENWFVFRILNRRQLIKYVSLLWK